MRQLLSYRNTCNKHIMHLILKIFRLAYMRVQCYYKLLKICYIIKGVTVKLPVPVAARSKA
jgi:hypothetical protein